MKCVLYEEQSKHRSTTSKGDSHMERSRRSGKVTSQARIDS